METLNVIRPELLSLSAEQMNALMPYFLVFGGALLTLLLGVVRSFPTRWVVFLAAVVTAVAGIWATVGLFSSPSQALFDGMLLADYYSGFFYVIFLGSAAFTLFASFGYLDRESMQHPEYYVLVLFSTVGMMLMAAAADLIVIFIALELMSLCVYVLVGFRRHDRKSNEAAMKYFILGGAASALLLYGVALIYGATQTVNIREVLTVIQSNPVVMTPIFTLGVWLVVVGFLFKVAAVPFHMWMPDVYEGAPTPITGFMTTGLKAAAFAAFVRVLIFLGYGNGLSEAIQSHLHDILWVFAVLTMLVGNVIALTQSNLKRMLAYSSIAHSGYLLVGMLAGPGSEQGYAPVLMYLLAYAIMNLGAFVILTMMAGPQDRGLNLHNLSGMARRNPWLSFSLAVFMLSLAGIPPTAGFVAKYYLFYSAVQAGEILLVVLSVLCSLIGVYYYLRVLVYMYMREPAGEPIQLNQSGSIWAAVAVAVMVVMTVQLGIIPSAMVEAAKRAILSL